MNYTSISDAEIVFGRDDSPSQTLVSAFADGQITITVQNQEVPGHACDNELTLGQAIQLRDFLNRHIDGLALAATGSNACRASDDPTQLSGEELLQAGLDAIAPAPLPTVDTIPHHAMGGELLGAVTVPGPTGKTDAPAGVLHLVWSLDKTECVGFYDEYQADWASSATFTGSCVSALAMAIREDQARQHDTPFPVLPRTTVTFY